MVNRNDIAMYLEGADLRGLPLSDIFEIAKTRLYLEGLHDIDKYAHPEMCKIIEGLVTCKLEDLPLFTDKIEKFEAGKLIMKFRYEKGI